MSRGIIIFGAMGVGDTTLGKALALYLGFQHFDLDDYHWRWDTEIPYTVFRSKEERTEHLMCDISKCLFFVLSGSMWSIRKTFEPLFDLAVFMTAPAEIRAERIRNHSLARWGSRVLPGGDIYETHEAYRDYLACAKTYDIDITPQACMIQHEQWSSELPCPVLRVDGVNSIDENVEHISKKFLEIQNA